MDELVHHCLRELSFDGDLGTLALLLIDLIIVFSILSAYLLSTHREEDRSNPHHDNS